MTEKCEWCGNVIDFCDKTGAFGFQNDYGDYCEGECADDHREHMMQIGYSAWQLQKAEKMIEEMKR